jgi:TonB family protein
MRGMDGESPRGGGPEKSGEPRRRAQIDRAIKTPLDRPDWWSRPPELPWYKTITRRKALIAGGIILAIHVPFGIGFFQDMKATRIQALRKSQKLMLNYHQLYPCFGARVDGEALNPVGALASPRAVVDYKLSGTVGLGVTLKPDGSVAARCLAESSGMPGLDNAAYAAARSWKFAVPASKPGAMRLLSVRFDGSAKVAGLRAWTPAQKPPVPKTPAPANSLKK